MLDIPWTYQGREFTEEDGAGYTAFVYIITRTSTGRRYLGKKILLRKKTLKPLKGKTRKRHSQVKSDWETYWGSNKELLAEIEAGATDLTREVVRLCKTRGEANYYEAKYQLENDVLLNPDGWYNDWVMVKVSRSHLRGLISPPPKKVPSRSTF